VKRTVRNSPFHVNEKLTSVVGNASVTCCARPVGSPISLRFTPSRSPYGRSQAGDTLPLPLSPSQPKTRAQGFPPSCSPATGSRSLPLSRSGIKGCQRVTDGLPSVADRFSTTLSSPEGVHLSVRGGKKSPAIAFHYGDTVDMAQEISYTCAPL
jgi:hypothetical protein